VTPPLDAQHLTGLLDDLVDGLEACEASARSGVAVSPQAFEALLGEARFVRDMLAREAAAQETEEDPVPF